MPVSFDAGNSRLNEVERGLPFSLADDSDWSSALVVEDLRRTYEERRYQALGMIGERLHMLVFTPRGEALHVISLRRANQRERTRYVTQIRR